jgi:hypothetical protein
VDAERVEIVGQAFGRGGIAGSVELVDERLEPLGAVMLVGGVIQRLPVGLADAFALRLGQLREQVAQALNGACWRRRGAWSRSCRFVAR